MHRIDTLTAVKDKFGPGKNGFTDGNLRTGRLATWLNSAMWDAIQEEICGVIEKVGIELNKEEHDQLYKAILLLVGGAINEEALLIKNNLSDVEDRNKAVKNLGAACAHSGSISTGGDNGNWTTAQFIDWLDAQGAFNHPYWMCKGSWSYASNKIITDTGCGNIQLAGAVVEVMGVKNAMTIRVTTPTTVTNGTANAQFTYINHGNDYSPGWRRDYNTKNPQPAFALGQTGSRVANDKAVDWNWNSGVYDATISGASTLILHFNMNSGSCPAVQFRVNYRNGGIYYRSARDRYGFEADWSAFYTTTNKPSAGDVGAYTKEESDARYQTKSGGIQGVRLGSVQKYSPPGNEVSWSQNLGSGNVLTGIIVQDTGKNSADNIGGIYYRQLQYCVGGTWYNASSL